MKNQSAQNKEVTTFLDNLDLPLRDVIEKLREIILDVPDLLIENIKWNGPNYSLKMEDRITMRVQAPKQIQLIFHRGAKTKAVPATKLINDPAGLLLWKTNDRAIASFKTVEEVNQSRAALSEIVQHWLAAAAE
ncbi:MAG: DUF1801 domain-containing protein [Saprospiraceae bacterium]|nr:DUF1801 domain-containing protein [Saprospiraceae bacterium]